MKNKILIVLINIQLNLIFIEYYGMIGAALASIICFSLLIPFNFYYCAKYLRHQTSPGS
ncbi:MAG: polysaccharide biosynthesis C-terminal domain-containing protein [Nitrospinae bacterium]|nr:polysaccharide biosynthesis C-terminal domain-containing protein [Nitrospinota bacterium]MCH7650355.1 polysaccharide biosynthesis C-terminal domain-containing protein [Nitrospinota bacterium]